MNMIITRQDRSDAKDAKELGIGLNEYKDAKALISFTNKTISKAEILNMVKNMHTRVRVFPN
jgi:hypothetical protein